MGSELDQEFNSIAQSTLYLVHFPLKSRKELQERRTRTKAPAEGQVGSVP